MRAAGPIRDGAENRAVEAWLSRSLAERYDATLNEAVPGDLLALLELLH